MWRRDERGAVVPMVAVVMTVLLGIAALAVDIGQQRVARSDMQALADVVAIDLARELDGRAASVIQPGLQAAADASRARNADTIGATAVVVPELGTLGPGGTFSPVSGAAVPTAVRVTASTSVDFAFRPGSGGAGRTAVATSSSTACFELGSYAAALTSTSATSSLLDSLLGQVSASYSIGAASYTGLTDAQVSLLDLATGLGVGSVDKLVTATVTLRDFYLVLADVLTEQGNTLDAEVLQDIAAGVGSAGPVAVRDLVQVAQGRGSAVNATIKVLDLLVGSAFLVHGGSTLTLPTMTSDLLGLGSVATSLRVVQEPQLACSGANPTPLVEATTSQVLATVTGNLPTTAITDPVLGLVGVTAGTPTNRPVTATVSLASARGHLTSITCPTPSSTTAGMGVATQSGLASAAVTVPVTVSGRLDLGLLSLVQFTIDATLQVSTSSQPSVGSVRIEIPPSAYDAPVSSGTGSLTLTGMNVSTVESSADATLLGIGPYHLSTAQVDKILAAVATAVVTPLVNTLDANLVAPLASLTGLRLAGADVIPLRKPTCATPALSG